MSLFIGKWVDGNHTVIDVTGQNSLLSVKYPNRGPFTGYELDLPCPAAFVAFTDDKNNSGVLSLDHSKIYWSNGTNWTRG